MHTCTYMHMHIHTKMGLSMVVYGCNPSILGGKCGRNNVRSKVILVYITSSVQPGQHNKTLFQ